MSTTMSIVPRIKIETYWNVNEEWGRRMASELRIKIETYWNVNTTFNTWCVGKIN